MEQRLNRQAMAGFTLVETVALLVVLAVLAAVAVARMPSRTDYDLPAQVDAIKNHIRYAQSRAMASGEPWGIEFESATTYYLFAGEGSTTPLTLPGETGDKVNLTDKKSKLLISGTPIRITFDGFGSPGATTIDINTNGETITVTRNTGFIP